MGASAAPYVQWLSAASARAGQAAGQAAAAAAVFETAQSATVPPEVVAANRVQMQELVATNVLGQNTPGIAATEAAYEAMWAEDVEAMAGYQGGSASVVARLVPAEAATPLSEPMAGPAPVVPAGGGAGSQLVSSLTSVAPLALTPAGYAISPLMSLLSGGAGGGSSSAGVAALPAAAAAPVTGAGAGLGPVAAGVGQAHVVRALSVPPNWGVSATGSLTGGSILAPCGAAAVSAAAGGVGAPVGSGVGGAAPMPVGMPLGGAGAAAAGAGGASAAGSGGTGGGVQVTSSRPNVMPQIV